MANEFDFKEEKDLRIEISSDFLGNLTKKGDSPLICIVLIFRYFRILHIYIY
jgi:hypothetical protein